MNHVVSFGGGVQSSALALLCIRRDPRLLAATDGALPSTFVFADTGDEPAWVYENIAMFKTRIESAGFDFVTVQHKDGALSDHIMTRAENGQRGINMPPMFTKGKDGRGMIRRGCTARHKSTVLDRYSRARFEIKRGQKTPTVATWLGISTDEASRMRVSVEKWRNFFYPLIEMRWRRSDCAKLIASEGLTVQKSACSYCPFHSNNEWRRIQQDAEEWRKVVDFEQKIQAAFDKHGHIAGLKNKPFLHPSLEPIESIDFVGNQLDLPFGFDNECAGICGV